MHPSLNPASLRRAAPAIGLAAGAALALAIAAAPAGLLETPVVATGIDQWIAAARPPLGATARSVLALFWGGVLASAVYAGLWLALRPREPRADGFVLRRSDAHPHPDAPPRRPFSMGEVAKSWSAAPRIASAVTRKVPADLDTPLAAVDPGAIPSVPKEPVRPVAPLVRAAPEEDAAEPFALTPIRRAPPPMGEPVARTPPAAETPVAEAEPLAAPIEIAPPSPPARPTSLAAMLDRLERGAARRGSRPVPPPEQALGRLGRLAPR